MTAITPLSYLPDLDTAWGANPGALSAITNLAPLARGSYGSIGSIKKFAITGTNYLHAKLFRKIDGTVRCLVFRTQNIDEYTSTGTRTNQKTSLSSSTANWCAASFGDAIIATNYLDAVQVSTGSTFSDLTGTGTPPKARLVAANQNFVMLADYNDGTAYPDGWWSSGVGNHTSWTPDLATQAANGRLLDVPGPIRALVPFRDAFVAYKDTGIILLEYVYSGASSVVWAARTISNTVGAHGMRAVVELNGVLYSFCSSGVYAFDGNSVVSIGGGVDATMLALLGEIDRYHGSSLTDAVESSIGSVEAYADDVEGIVWFMFTSYDETLVDETGAIPAGIYGFGYNTRSKRWGRFYFGAYSSRPIVLHSKHRERKSFGVADANYARIPLIKSKYGTSALYLHAYPYKSTTTDETLSAGSLTTGAIGTHGQAITTMRAWWHTGSDSACSSTSQIATLTANAYHNSGKTFALASGVPGYLNSELDCGDIRIGGPFATLTLNMLATVPCELFGIGIDATPTGKR